MVDLLMVLPTGERSFTGTCPPYQALNKKYAPWKIPGSTYLFVMKPVGDITSLITP
jgi:hypothetical protein